jgi:hypothetical protein
MSAGEQRRRKRLAREKVAQLSKNEKRMKRLKNAGHYAGPPGITYRKKVTVLKEDGAAIETFLPETKPLAAINRFLLDDDDIKTLVRELAREARRRGIDVAALLDEAKTEHGVLQVLRPRHDHDGSTYVGPDP